MLNNIPDRSNLIIHMDDMTDTVQSPITQALLADPVAVYRDISARIEKTGDLTPMPEFEPVVRYLQEELKKPDIIDYCKENSFAEASRQLALNALWHTDLEFTVSPETGGYHQHKPPATGRFPYQPTLKAIDEAIGFFDSYERATKRGHDLHYQLDRYRYHGQTLPFISGWVVMPTVDTLTLRDLIILRTSPVGLTMVASRTNALDAYFNSPLNAKVHDDNHNRRMNSENQGYFERNGITTEAEKLAAYEEFHNTVQNVILPSMDITPDMSEKEQNIRKAMAVLYFEFLHEYAKTPDRETLITELTFAPDGPSAFEIILQHGETPEQLEKRRLDNKNLDSGAIFTRGQTGNTVYYFMDKGRNFLTSAYNKVTHGFYDYGQQISPEVPDPEHRTTEIFTEATQRIMKCFNISAEEIDLTPEKIRALLLNSAAGDVLGENLETYPGHDPENPFNKAPVTVANGNQSDAHVQSFDMNLALG